MKPRIVAIETEYGIEDMKGGCPEIKTIPGKVKTASTENFLPTGGRAYMDCGHPEYASPECRDCPSAALYDIAGQRVIHRAFAGSGYRIHRISRDMGNATFGSHENYSLQSGMMTGAIKLLASSLKPFLVTRQIFAGAGHYDPDSEAFQISQRSDSIETDVSEDTQGKRPIVYAGRRGESHSTHYDRLHLIVGESNMMHYPDLMKMATTCMVLDMTEDDGWKPSFEIENPVTAMRNISRSKWVVTTTQGKTISAVDVQRYYHEKACSFYERHGQPDPETSYYLNGWGNLLDALEKDHMSLFGKVEWVTKKGVLFDGELTPNERKNAAIEWHNIDPDEGVYYMLVEDGLVERYFSDEQIEGASNFPPPDTRARLRGKFVHYVPEDRRVDMNWNHIGNFEMPDPFDAYEGHDEEMAKIASKLPSSAIPTEPRSHDEGAWGE